jgi:hypothetical protein
MSRFESEREAKEYLVGRIVGEAEREGVSLTEVERKMLYFTESGWTLPDMMEVNAAFERDCDNDTYERKIVGLAQNIEKRNNAEGGEAQAAWNDAVQKLQEGDHYLLVLIDSQIVSAGGAVRPPGDILKLVLTAIACSFGLLILFGLYAHFFLK